MRNPSRAALCLIAVALAFVLSSVALAADVRATGEEPVEIASVPLQGDIVHLRATCDFQPAPELARFSYSLDGREWISIGRPSQMAYTLPHFMGYRFGLFRYATQAAGGHADFDYYRVAPSTD
jgi:hypothetical protein